MFSANLKKPELSDGLRRWSDKKFQPEDLQWSKPDSLNGLVKSEQFSVICM